MTYSYVVDGTNLFDNNYDSDETNYLQSSTFVRWVFTTNARACWLKAYANATLGDCEIGVFVNGSYYTTLSFTAQPAQEVFQFSLPAGNKTVELVAGAISKPVATILGVYLKVVYFSGGDTVTEQTPTAPEIVVYGESIVVSIVDVPPVQCWPVLLRNTYGHRVAVDAWGWRSLFSDAPDAAGRTALSAQLAGYAPTVGVWLAIGLNDYQLETQSAADFGVAYADLLDKLHTDLPAATIYCQTPITKTSEAANTFGDTLGDYRTAIATAQSSRSAYCTLVDGTAWTIALADGVHPNVAGHAAYAANVDGIL